MERSVKMILTISNSKKIYRKKQYLTYLTYHIHIMLSRLSTCTAPSTLATQCAIVLLESFIKKIPSSSNLTLCRPVPPTNGTAYYYYVLLVFFFKLFLLCQMLDLSYYAYNISSY